MITMREKINNYIYELAKEYAPLHNEMCVIELAKRLNSNFNTNYLLNGSRGIYTVIRTACDARHKRQDFKGAFIIERYFVNSKGEHIHEKRIKSIKKYSSSIGRDVF